MNNPHTLSASRVKSSNIHSINIGSEYIYSSQSDMERDKKKSLYNQKYVSRVDFYNSYDFSAKICACEWMQDFHELIEVKVHFNYQTNGCSSNYIE
jgi:hypothetical protein